MTFQWTWERVPEAWSQGLGEFVRLCNRRFRDLQQKVASLVSLPTGGGTATVLPKWDATGTGLADSAVKDTGTQVQIAARPLRMDNGVGNGIRFKNAAGTFELTGLCLTASDELSLLGAWSIPSIGGAQLLPVDDGLQDVGSSGQRINDLYAAGTLSADGGATFGADVDFNQHQGIEFVVENRTSDPGSPVTGQLWIRTDL